MPDRTRREGLSQSTQIELLWQRLDNLEAAIDKQAIEYERRMEILNNARTEARSKEREFLQTSVYVPAAKEQEKKIEEVKATLSAMQDVTGDLKVLSTKVEDLFLWRSRVVGVAVGAGLMSGVIGGLIASSIAHWIIR